MSKKNESVTVTLTQFHLSKLDIIRKRTNLSKTGVIQRLIENFELFETEKKDLKA